MEPVLVRLIQILQLLYFYPQAPHGACHYGLTLNSQLKQFLSSGSAWSLSAMFFDYLIMYSLFLSSGSAWSLSESVCVTEIQALISILRLRMEPVAFDDSILSLHPKISILRLRMEPVSAMGFRIGVCYDFYPQAPHGACHRL